MIFCDEYLVDLNASKAALRAGYSPLAVRTIASKLLSKANISSEIRKKINERAARTRVTADRVLLEIALIGLFDLRDVFNEDGRLKRVVDMSEDTTRSLAGIDVMQRVVKDDEGKYIERVIKVKTRDKIRALELMGKHLGMFRDIGDELPDLAGMIVEAQQRALEYKRETEKKLAQEADFEDITDNGDSGNAVDDSPGASG